MKKEHWRKKIKKNKFMLWKLLKDKWNSSKRIQEDMKIFLSDTQERLIDLGFVRAVKVMGTDFVIKIWILSGMNRAGNHVMLANLTKGIKSCSGVNLIRIDYFIFPGNFYNKFQSLKSEFSEKIHLESIQNKSNNSF